MPADPVSFLDDQHAELLRLRREIASLWSTHDQQVARLDEIARLSKHARFLVDRFRFIPANEREQFVDEASASLVRIEALANGDTPNLDDNDDAIGDDAIDEQRMKDDPSFYDPGKNQ